MSRFNGSAIVITVLAIAGMTTVLLGVAELVPRDFRQSQALESSLQAEGAAWAGIEHALLLLKDGRAHNDYFQLSDEMRQNHAPYGAYTQPLGGVNCITDRGNEACRGLDRKLGLPRNQTPYSLESVKLLGSSAFYQLAVWHLRQNVGNVSHLDNLEDGLSSDQNKTRTAANINPVLNRDEVRRLDFQGVAPDDTLTIQWRPFDTDGCKSNDAGTTTQLLYTLLDDQGHIVNDPAARGLSAYPKNDTATTLVVTRLGNAQTLALRLLVTNSNQSLVQDCFIRYSLENKAPQGNLVQTADLGFDVIDSEGISGGVRRKIRVLVDRENGRPLNIFDFGIACETCSSLN